MHRAWKKLSLALLGASILSAAPAQAVTINLIDSGGVTGSPAERGFRAAAAYWESVLTNDAVLNLQVGFADLGPGVLGGASSSILTYVPVTSYYSLLSSVRSSALDNLAVLPGLSSTGSLTVTVPEYFNPATQSGVATSGSRIAPDGTFISDSIGISTANVKALYNDSALFEADFGTVIDANIDFSTEFSFDFDPTDGIDQDSFDFIGVAIHEIGHALGFLSGAQDFDYSTGIDFPVDEFWWGYTSDLFRYSAPGVLDWTFNTDSYFSIDGGVTPFLDGFFSTGAVYGDGNQASHWKEPAVVCGDFRGIMNPYICNGRADDVEALDLALLDAIGWNTNVDVIANPGYTFNTAGAFGLVPEPSAWAMMILGVGAIGGTLRRRRQRMTVTFATA